MTFAAASAKTKEAESNYSARKIRRQTNPSKVSAEFDFFLINIHYNFLHISFFYSKF